MTADQPLADPDRLAAVAAARSSLTLDNDAIERIARLAAGHVGAPVALMTLVDDQRQYVLGSFGLGRDGRSSGGPLADAVCRHVVERGDPFGIRDARTTSAFADHPAVSKLGLVSYLGVPVRSQRRAVIGALCVVDRRPRVWLASDRSALTDLAELVGDHLALRLAISHAEDTADRLYDQTTRDELTGLHNLRYWRERAPIEVARSKRSPRPLAAAMFDADGFKAVNTHLGHAAGDAVLRRVGAAWANEVRPPDILIRRGGDEFALLATDASEAEAVAIAARLITAVADTISFSVGIAEWNGSESASDLLHRADLALGRAKEQRR